LAVIVYLIRKYRKYKTKQETKKELEGEIAERELENINKERLQSLANTYFSDIFPDHIAAGFRQWGDSPLEAWLKMNRLYPPSNIIRDRLQVMAQNGYTGLTTRSEDDEIIDAEVIEEDTVDEENIADNQALESLADPSDELIEALDWSSDSIKEFDMRTADVDPETLDTTPCSLELGELLEELDMEMQRFEDPKEFGEYFYEFTESVKNHAYTDQDGAPDNIRTAMEAFLDAANLLGDKYKHPLAKYWQEALKKALERKSESNVAEQTVAAIRRGE
ncbi:MAG: hypothetical protein ABEI52_01285, partial [Halobacteriaceae archaeon]